MTFKRNSGAVVPLAALLLLAACASEPTEPVSETITLSVVGTNDIHGAFVPEENRGGLVTLSGYVDALRAARDADGGAVLLIDAGDMWQGTLESNLVEGKSVVEAYNAMGFDAATIGNHEFDFGPAGPAATPREPGDDPRGVLKQRAREMNFPFLSANLIDAETKRLIGWDNVFPSIMLNVDGLRIGVTGAITRDAPNTTIRSKIAGLEVERLAHAVQREALKLRGDGAQLVILTTHAGGQCEDFSDPYDLSSCNMRDEVFRLATRLPEGLVDHIIGGHEHQPIAHFVNGTSVTASYAHAEQFGRADFTFDRSSGALIGHAILPPQLACPSYDASGGDCVWDGSGAVAATYEGHPIVPNQAVVVVSNRAVAYAKSIKNELLGPVLETPITQDGNPESPLGNLFVDAVLEGAGGDISIHNVSGGLRADLNAGPLTFGDAYQVMPFDNRVIVLDLSGAEVRSIVAAQAHNHDRRAGIGGLRVRVQCDDGRLHVDMTLNDGHVIADDDRVRVVVNDFLVLGGDGILTPILSRLDDADDDGDTLVRDLLVDWLRAAPETPRAEDFLTQGEPRWDVPADLPASCSL